MNRKRIKLEVYVNLDMVPGTFHTKESAQEVVARMLSQSIPHYNPKVFTTRYETSYDPIEALRDKLSGDPDEPRS